MKDFKLSVSLPEDAKSTNLQDLLQLAQIQSNIPEGSGLGSSAALSVALSHTIQKDTNNPALLFENAKLFEDCYHAGSSGIDVFTSLNGGLCKLHSKDQFEKLSEHLEKLKQFKFSIIDTGERRNVRNVKSKIREQDLKDFLPVAEMISNEFTDKLYTKTLELRDMISLFNRAQRALTGLKVSTMLIDNICNKIITSNLPIGIKITGAGGGGCLLLVHNHTVSKQCILDCLVPNDNLHLYYDVAFTT